MTSCPFCNLQFSSPRWYKKHLLRHHSLGLTKLPTVAGGSTYQDAVSLLGKSGTPQFACSDCGKRLRTQATLMQHRLTHVKPFKCCICSRRFSQRVNLLDHERVHTGEQPFFCDLCGRKFSQQANLHTHRKIHLVAKDFHCSMCHKGFVQKINLMSHLEKVHLARLPFFCPRCRCGSTSGFCLSCGSNGQSSRAL
ncbi:hypothetical protein BOX15_Mlig012806g1 [Macrostomum lignano]|uniref:C2H2-type domain-containing protein n=1 Tax=Macrostomum lignano TaxID=282301 RepID=A0A267GF70_9PLAT|nr:hypothetical protein BOX15_Mlig012806g1 [Macrostomum lignano]